MEPVLDAEVQERQLEQDIEAFKENKLIHSNSLVELSASTVTKENLAMESPLDFQLQNTQLQDTRSRQHSPLEHEVADFEDNHVVNLQLLGELPDHEMELFNTSQRPDGRLDEFAWFNQLPTEVRCMIWRACFPPGRPVYLQRGYFEYDEDLDRFYVQAGSAYVVPQNDCIPPITAFINHESRLETEKFYGMLFQRVSNGFNYVKMSRVDRDAAEDQGLATKLRWKQSRIDDNQYNTANIDQLLPLQEVNKKESFMKHPQRIWFNPETDTAVMDVNALFYCKNSALFLADLFSNDRRRASSIRVLEIRGFGGVDDLETFVEKYGKNVLLFFQDLIELRFIWHQVWSEDEDLLHCETEGLILIYAMKKVVEQMQGRYANFKAPEMSVFHKKELIWDKDHYDPIFGALS
ncbi:hypothetical protein NHQ30_008894 [Ciborinia camelliae]|nr:hypothetical protein NHQ30_008894 [Ciborinia camelliae]